MAFTGDLGRVQGGSSFHTMAASSTSIAVSNLQPQITPFEGDSVQFPNGDVRQITAVSGSTVTLGEVLFSYKGDPGIGNATLSGVYGTSATNGYTQKYINDNIYPKDGEAVIPNKLPNPNVWYKLLSFTAIMGNNVGFRTQGVTLIYNCVFQEHKYDEIASGLLIIKNRTNELGGVNKAEVVFEMKRITGEHITANNFRITFESETNLVSLWFQGDTAFQDICVTQLSVDRRLPEEKPEITYYQTPATITPSITDLPGEVFEFTEDTFVYESEVPIYFSTVNSSPAQTIGGDWISLGSFTIGSTTVYAWRRV